MPKIQANNCEMYYEVDDYTDPWLKQTDTIWLQHGVGRSSRFWYHWVPALVGRYRVVRRDLRGHGQSSDPGRDHKWSIDELIDDMKGFLDALELDRVHYVGESIRASARKALTGGDRELTSELGKVGGGGWVKILIEQKVISGKDQAHIDWVVREWSKTPTHVLQGITRMLAGADITPLLSQVRVPTLVIAPSRSPLTSLADQITIRNSIPDARIAVVEGPGHEIYVDEPEQCISALLRFLGWL